MLWKKKGESSFLPSVLNLDYGTTKGAVYSIVPTNPLAASKEHVHANIRNRNAGLIYEPSEVNSTFTKDRILPRDAAFHQSKGRMNIKKLIKQADWAQLYADDLFHSMIDAPTSRTLLLLVACYLTIVFFYAVLYLFVEEVYGCNLGVRNLVEALFFSLETMATIGYGTEDIFFGDCMLLGSILTSQICVKIISDALVIGVIYCRVSRPNKRASTIVFTKTAIIKRIRGRLYLQFRVCELRKHQLVEAHIRCYTIRHERDVQTGAVTPFRSMSMRLNHPNDELGAMLLMCLPQEVVHEIDAWSPIMPPPTWGSAIGVYHWDPPTLAHAKVQQSGKSSSGRKGFDMASYNPDLWFNYPDVMRRSASEAPMSEFRSPHPHIPSSRSAHATKRTFGNGTGGSGGSGSAAAGHSIKHVLHDISVPTRDSTLTPPRPRNKSLYSDGRVPYSTMSSGEVLASPAVEGAPSSTSTSSPFSACADRVDPLASSSFDDSSNSKAEHSPHPYLTSYDATEQQQPNFTKFHYEEHWEIEEREMIRKFMIDRNVEIIALVEGNDATSGGSVQARHSYKIEDIVWNASFSPCVVEDAEDGHAAVIDYTLFHETKSDYPTPTTSFAELTPGLYQTSGDNL